MQNTIVAHKTYESRGANHQNSVIFSVDNNYLPYALFVAHQIIKLEKILTVDICICLPNLSALPKQLFESPIRFIEINIKGLDNLPFGRLSLSAYHRLFLPEILGADYKHLIYLDADTYILRPFTQDILAFINKLDSNFSVAAAADIIELQKDVVKKSKLKKLSHYVQQYHDHGHTYRNSGVLIFNCTVYNDNNIRDRIINYAFNNLDKLQCHDQSAINGALLNELAFLPFVFNWQMHKLTLSFIDEFKPYILHFIGDNKPWRLKNYITDNYYQDYIDFFETNDLNHHITVLTTYERRLQHPKYKGFLKERISRETQRFKMERADQDSKLPADEICKIRSILSSDNFIRPQ